ncbi:nucleolar protein 4-like isoform X2 [Rhinichthys klamathensis goyatoka]|uniref:nucleolar protein 4-like isoform X2 n=1 Tax=Rhinichthys klamathensis goyatoka TaxID=3034132 RepID=UPI0024B4A2CF|nr:nucleolar protein 4-like isoform X2 [Rhinichthys klamathensis goyatoka]
MATKKPCADLTKRSRSPVVLEAEMFSEFQDWCLRTYGDSGKTKTVTRRKYNKIMQTLLQNEESDGVYVDNSHINAKFKFWVKSKGFQVGSNILGEHNKKEASGKPVLYVPVKSTCSDGGAAQDSSLKRVAVVEDFFDIIYAMHVEMGADPGRAPKHAGQKKTYKAIAETYAFLPREAVTRFLMSCGECQKRMHINPSTAEFKENDRPTSLVPDLIDYNMPLTATYLKQMKLQCMNTNEQDESSVSSEDLDMAEPAWVSTERAPAAEPSSPTAPYTERMPTPPQPSIKEEEDDSSSENSSTVNGLPALTPPGGAAMATGGVPASEGVVPYGEVNGNGAAAPLDFSTTSSSSSSQEGQQPVNLSDRLLPGVTLGSYSSDPNRKFPVKTEYNNKSPQYSSGSYDSVKTELSTCGEDMTPGRSQVIDDDDEDHDDHDDSDKINDAEGLDPERLKAFNMFVRLFVDENLDRMVPISKQPKEKIQAIIESCSRQFPEFQERSRKRIRTYLKSCRRMKKGGFETRPTPPHLTSAMAENILAAACESETRNAAKRMRLDIYQAHDESVTADKPNSRDPAALANSGFSLAAAAYSQDQLYTNGGLNYSFRGYGTLGNNVQNNGTSQTNGPTDLSMKSLASNSTSSSSSNSHGQGGGGGGASAQLSPPEVTAVRQLIAGYRESAAFLLRSADELENLILQQN